jgi:hypothetical protein
MLELSKVIGIFPLGVNWGTPDWNHSNRERKKHQQKYDAAGQSR